MPLIEDAGSQDVNANWASFKCHSIQKHCCWPCAFLYGHSQPFSKGYFQQDNAPCHKGRIISSGFHKHASDLSFLHWPAQLPDLNSMECFWDKEEVEVCSMWQKNLQEILEAIGTAWTKFPGLFWRQKWVLPSTTFAPKKLATVSVTYWFLSGFCLLCFSVSLLVSVSLAFCHVLALVFPNYVLAFMFTFDLSRALPESVSRFCYFRVWRSFSKSSFSTNFLIPAATLFT